MKKHIVVIGGGLAGSAAAYSLTSQGYDVTILERNGYIGGRVRSIHADGTAFETGAGFLKNIYTSIFTFLDDNHMKSKLYRQQGSSGILREGTVRMTAIPTLLGNSTLSWPAKFLALKLLAKVTGNWQNFDIHSLWRAIDYDTRTVAEMFESRAGQELLEYAVQPVLNGYLYWNPEHTSEAMLLIIAKAFMQDRTTYKLIGGLQQIPEQAASTSQILLNHKVQTVRKKPGQAYEITAAHQGKTVIIAANGIVCATTASVVPHIIPSLNREQLAFFKSVQYSSTALLAQIYEQSQAKGDKGIGFPRNQGTHLAAATISPEPGPLQPAGRSALKIYASGQYGKSYVAKKDDVLAADLLSQFSAVRDSMLLPTAKPLSAHIQRWPEALPFFDVGHFQRLRSFEDGKIESSDPGLVFAGDYLGGPLMEGAFTSGLRAAERLHNHLAA
jgi:oxygen-dependent protoporphyrinogen oxidase